MRVLLKVSSVISSVIGIRRFSGTHMDVEDFKSQLKKHGPRDVVGLLQSFVQGTGSAKWTESINDELTSVIGNLTTDIVHILDSENADSQEEGYLKMNTHEYWIEARNWAEKAANTAEVNLFNAVVDEKEQANLFVQEVIMFKAAALLIAQPCSEQQAAMTPVIVVSPQSTFTCDFSVTDSSQSDHCGTAETAYADNVSAEVNSLNSTLGIQKTTYEAAEKKCAAKIQAADDALNRVKNYYNEWVNKRTAVVNSYGARKSIVCGVKSCKGKFQWGVPLEITGLNQFMQSEVSSGLDAVSYYSAVSGVNNTQSLSDRNYEVDSLAIVECLLSKLHMFGAGNWSNQDFTTTLTSCSDKTDKNYVSPAYQQYDIIISSSREFEVVADVDLICLTGAMTAHIPRDYVWLLSFSVVKRGFVKVGFADDKISQYLENGGGIPEKLNEDIQVPPAWNSAVVAETGDCDIIFFEDQSAAEYHPRTGFTCGSADYQPAVDDPSLLIDNLARLRVAEHQVPQQLDYKTRANGQRAFTATGFVSDCS